MSQNSVGLIFKEFRFSSVLTRQFVFFTVTVNLDGRRKHEKSRVNNPDRLSSVRRSDELRSTGRKDGGY